MFFKSTYCLYTGTVRKGKKNETKFKNKLFSKTYLSSKMHCKCNPVS